MRVLLPIIVAAACSGKSVADRSDSELDVSSEQPRADTSRTAGSAAECPVLSVTVDGTPLPAMTNGLAFSYKLNGYDVWHVDLSDVAQTCEHYMGKDGRILRDGETTVNASVGGPPAVEPVVGIANMRAGHDRVTIVGATPRKPGDKLTLCVAAASFKGSFGTSYNDKRIVMNGKFEGTYCGEKPL